jgi:hypothetical protein
MQEGPDLFAHGEWSLSSESAGLVLGGMVFGAGHCIAWNFDFSTSVELTLWRVASVATAAVMPAMYTVQSVLAQKLFKKIPDTFSILTTYVAVVVYVVARLFLLAEMFRSLFHLPPEAFVGT